MLSHTETFSFKNGSEINSSFTVVVQSPNRVPFFVTPWTALQQASQSFTISGNLFKLMSIKSVMLSNHFILCHPLLLLPLIFPRIRVFSKSWLFTSGGQSIEASASALVLPMNIQSWFPLGLTGLISLLSKGLSRCFWCFWIVVLKNW